MPTRIYAAPCALVAASEREKKDKSTILARDIRNLKAYLDRTKFSHDIIFDLTS